MNSHKNKYQILSLGAILGVVITASLASSSAFADSGGQYNGQRFANMTSYTNHQSPGTTSHTEQKFAYVPWRADQQSQSTVSHTDQKFAYAPLRTDQKIANIVSHIDQRIVDRTVAVDHRIPNVVSHTDQKFVDNTMRKDQKIVDIATHVNQKPVDSSVAIQYAPSTTSTSYVSYGTSPTQFTPTAPAPIAISHDKIPNWVKDVFAFYLAGKLSDHDLIHTIQYLVSQGIINS